MEKRSFTVHPAILHSIIHAQAGSLPKALLEGVMNAVDAGAKKCDITIDCHGFIVADNGTGFADRAAIENYFEQFGTPHQQGDATYGRFRMGRGQLMAFAETIWETGEFRMEVDIKHKGMDYTLATGLKKQKGCKITGKLYAPLSTYDLNSLINEFESMVYYTEIPVKLNGRVISRHPAKQKWDLETDEAYIKLAASGDLKVYNLGVLVRGYGAYRFGMSGTVVSKKQLQVNFARNDILEHQCDVWRQIRKDITGIAKTRVAKKTTLTDGEREFLARQILSDCQVLAMQPGYQHSDQQMALRQKYLESRVIETAAKTNITLSAFIASAKVSLACSKKGQLAERLHRSKVAVVVSSVTLDRFNVCTLEELVQKLMPLSYSGGPAVVDFDTLSLGYAGSNRIVPSSDVKPDVALVVRALTYVKDHLESALKDWRADSDERGVGRFNRDIVVGVSDQAQAWTDARSYIAVEQRYLAKVGKSGFAGWSRLFALMLHEYLHDDSDAMDHEHPPEFFEAFEDFMCSKFNNIAWWATLAARRYAELSLSAGGRFSQAVARELKVSEALPADVAPAISEIVIEKPSRKAKPSKASQLRADFMARQGSLF